MTSSQFETFIRSRTGIPQSRVGLASRFLRGMDLWPYTIGEDARQVTPEDAARFLIALACPYSRQQFERTCNSRDEEGKTFFPFLVGFIKDKILARSCMLITISCTPDIVGGIAFWDIAGQKVARSFQHNDNDTTGESLIIPGQLIQELFILISENETVYN